MHYHLIGIAGTAMGSLAGLLREKGHRVTGSDEGVYPPMSTLLDALGIEYAHEFDPINLDPVPDLVVVGNAISRGNPELEAVLDRGLRYRSAASVLKEEFLEGRHVVAVAGTHGKTTTTTLIAWLLECAGLDPSFLVGGVSTNFGGSFRLRDSNLFVIEADEYDTAYFDKGPKMWHYLPHTAVVTNVEFDHADIYRDEAAYDFAFERFVNLIPRTGTLVLGWDSPKARKLGPGAHAAVESFGLEAGSDGPRWTATEIRAADAGTSFVVSHDGEALGRAELPMFGRYNVSNALAAVAAAHAAGAPAPPLLEGLRGFEGVRRRMELRGEAGGVTVVDDFAHHPTAVRGVIQAARQRFPDRRLVAVFEPRSYTAQRREFQDAFRDALAGADRVVLAGLFHPERYTDSTGLDPERLVGGLRSEGVTADFVPDVDSIVDLVAAESVSGDVVLVLSNGGFGGIHQKLLDRLS